MKIAIFGASSQIAKDMIAIINIDNNIDLHLYSRNIKSLSDELNFRGIDISRLKISEYESFPNKNSFNVIMNFIGIGDPRKGVNLGAEIFDITYEYDSIVIKYLRNNIQTKYIFISSGAVYGVDNFSKAPNETSKAIFNVNELNSQEWYSISKIHAECRHRAFKEASIIDVRIFNYISSQINLNSSFFITDAINAIIDKKSLKTSRQNIYRDYIGPDDLYNLIMKIIDYGFINNALDCYTKLSTNKFDILEMLYDEFGLNYEFTNNRIGGIYTGNKSYYYSKNRKASKYDYEPEYTSLETIKLEIQKILD